MRMDDGQTALTQVMVAFRNFANAPKTACIYDPLQPDGEWINRLKPTGHVMRHQFNIQQLYVLPTLYLCVLCLSENKQRLVPLTA